MRKITLALKSYQDMGTGIEIGLAEVAALGAALTAATLELRGAVLEPEVKRTPMAGGESVDYRTGKLVATVSVTVGPLTFVLRAEESAPLETAP